MRVIRGKEKALVLSQDVGLVYKYLIKSHQISTFPISNYQYNIVLFLSILQRYESFDIYLTLPYSTFFILFSFYVTVR